MKRTAGIQKLLLVIFLLSRCLVLLGGSNSREVLNPYWKSECYLHNQRLCEQPDAPFKIKQMVYVSDENCRDECFEEPKCSGFMLSPEQWLSRECFLLDIIDCNRITNSDGSNFISVLRSCFTRKIGYPKNRYTPYSSKKLLLLEATTIIE
ncbi:hypothetical protein ACHWQZ_G003914 [Mnemiopsis leidyi]